MSMACRRTTLRRVLEVVERCHRKATGALSDAASTAVVSQSRKIASSTNSLALSRWGSSIVPRATIQVPFLELRGATNALSFSSAATPQVDGKDGSSPGTSTETTATPASTEDEPVQTQGGAERKGGHEEVEKEDMVGLLAEKLALIEQKEKEVKELKDKLLWSLAEMENVRDRARRDADSTRKFAVQSFAKGLLDVADNLSRAAAAVPEKIAKSNAADDPTGTVKLLQSLLQGVEMTEKQLLQAFKKQGLEKFDPLGEAFDPSKHAAIFEVDDATKTPGTVAMVLKAGYSLNERVIRPAEVAVVKEPSA
ncbi:molecular chaperone GrpE [Marchantia polymorpha subsp. ruderalis]|uniref:GrpE protein homolog n=2 Tax=Marchantia polymorpha TaxID=3197 RepID=A0AAF6C1G5_MARPO|nr:hypothetical protein MARPO_0067s0028 [Marchantia polymorpha]BBN18099.1 hypothetical protein Mp_7g19490 [Marchantia polymorpha subsp. ruderalis]|eukprot:PTQ35934.1 hypothetical protein MARPO_0067s0028 [Marchantia polymorpha]